MIDQRIVAYGFEPWAGDLSADPGRWGSCPMSRLGEASEDGADHRESDKGDGDTHLSFAIAFRTTRRSGSPSTLHVCGFRIDRVVDTLRCAVLIPQNEIGMRDALRRQILRQGRALARGKRPRRGVASSLGAHWSLKLLG